MSVLNLCIGGFFVLFCVAIIAFFVFATWAMQQ